MIHFLKRFFKVLLTNSSFDATAEQLRYAGVLEAIRVSRVGFSQRYVHESFIGRYGFLISDCFGNDKDIERIDLLVNELAKLIWTDQNPGTSW